MRLSCLGLTRIRNEKGQYTLLINQGKADQGRGRVLSPIGGALEVSPDISYLEQTFGAQFENGLDLRFRVDDARVNDVIKWFERREAHRRETTAMREVFEELVKETGLLDAPDLRGAREKYVRTVRHDEKTTRPVVEKQTVYLVEVYDVELPKVALAKLQAAAMQDWPVIYFATEYEIMRGAMVDGTKIGSITQKLFQRAKLSASRLTVYAVGLLLFIDMVYAKNYDFTKHSWRGESYFGSPYRLSLSNFIKVLSAKRAR